MSFGSGLLRSSGPSARIVARSYSAPGNTRGGYRSTGVGARRETLDQSRVRDVLGGWEPVEWTPDVEADPGPNDALVPRYSGGGLVDRLFRAARMSPVAQMFWDEDVVDEEWEPTFLIPPEEEGWDYSQWAPHRHRRRASRARKKRGWARRWPGESGRRASPFGALSLYSADFVFPDPLLAPDVDDSEALVAPRRRSKLTVSRPRVSGWAATGQKSAVRAERAPVTPQDQPVSQSDSGVAAVSPSLPALASRAAQSPVLGSRPSAVDPTSRRSRPMDRVGERLPVGRSRESIDLERAAHLVSRSEHARVREVLRTAEALPPETRERIVEIVVSELGVRGRIVKSDADQQNRGKGRAIDIAVRRQDVERPSGLRPVMHTSPLMQAIHPQPAGLSVGPSELPTASPRRSLTPRVVPPSRKAFSRPGAGRPMREPSPTSSQKTPDSTRFDTGSTSSPAPDRADIPKTSPLRSTGGAERAPSPQSTGSKAIVTPVETGALLGTEPRRLSPDVAPTSSARPASEEAVFRSASTAHAAARMGLETSSPVEAGRTSLIPSLSDQSIGASLRTEPSLRSARTPYDEDRVYISPDTGAVSSEDDVAEVVSEASLVPRDSPVSSTPARLPDEEVPVTPAASPAVHAAGRLERDWVRSEFISSVEHQITGGPVRSSEVIGERADTASFSRGEVRRMDVSRPETTALEPLGVGVQEDIESEQQRPTPASGRKGALRRQDRSSAVKNASQTVPEGLPAALETAIQAAPERAPTAPSRPSAVQEAASRQDRSGEFASRAERLVSRALASGSPNREALLKSLRSGSVVVAGRHALTRRWVGSRPTEVLLQSAPGSFASPEDAGVVSSRNKPTMLARTEARSAAVLGVSSGPGATGSRTNEGVADKVSARGVDGAWEQMLSALWDRDGWIQSRAAPEDRKANVGSRPASTRLGSWELVAPPSATAGTAAQDAQRAGPVVGSGMGNQAQVASAAGALRGQASAPSTRRRFVSSRTAEPAELAGGVLPSTRAPRQDRFGRVVEGRDEAVQVPSEGARAAADLRRAFMGARSTDDMLRLIQAQPARLEAPVRSALAPPVVRLIERLRDEVVAGEQESFTRYAPAGQFGRARRSSGGARAIAGFQALPASAAATATDGMGVDRIERLARKLKQLVYLANVEQNRAGAQQMVRMAEDSSEARAEGSAPPEEGAPGDDQKVDINALGQEVLGTVMREMELRKERRQEDGDGSSIWW